MKLTDGIHYLGQNMGGHFHAFLLTMAMALP